MKVKFALPELFGIYCRWVPTAVIFLLALISISRAAYATEGPTLSPPVIQAQQAAEETVEKIIQFRHLEGLREIFGYFSHANSDVPSNLARRKQPGGIKIKLAEEALARVIENPNSQSMSTLPEPSPLLEPSSKPEAPIGDWFLWGFGAGVRTGYDSYKMPEISWNSEERFIVREDSFKPIAFKDQENFLSSQHIRRSAANAFTLGFKDGWSEGNVAASKDFPHLLPGQRYDCPRDTPAPGAERRLASLERLIESRAKVLGVEPEEANEIINQIDCRCVSFAYLVTEPAKKYSTQDLEILQLSWSQIISSKDVIFLVKKFSYVPSAKGESLEHMQQSAFDDAVAGRPWSAPVVMAHAAKSELNQAIISNVFRVLADKLLITFETGRTRNDEERH